MKAYEIKVTIKNSEPPIWREIIIPANINFMQLHNIIRVAFERQSYRLYKFTFKEFPDEITNDADALEVAAFFQAEECEELRKSTKLTPLDFPGCENIRCAKEILIADYFEKVEELTYVYDFVACRKHTIELVNVIDNYIGACPAVTKFEQSSPPERSDRIEEYYKFLEQYASETLSLEKQDHSGEYNIDEINESMKEILEWDFDEF